MVFYPRAITAILPIQIICFGVLGSVAGFWGSIKYDKWKEESQRVGSQS